MGFLDKVKKVTGVGLTPQQHYNRVYEKAILLGENNYNKGIMLFQKTAAQAAKAGDKILENRALANAAFYSFVTSGNAKYLPAMMAHMKHMEEIEQIGSRSDMMKTAPLVEEIQARGVESQTLRTGRNYTDQAECHRMAAEAWKKLGTAELYTYKYTSPDQHKDTAIERFFYNLGQASWYDAMANVEITPDSATEHMAKALNYFRQCNNELRAHNAQTWLAKCRIKRSCWMCSREFQGEDLHFKSYPSDLAPYILSVVQALGQDTHTLNLDENELILCRPCGSTIDKLADHWASKRTNELRKELQKALKQVNSSIREIQGTLRNVDSRLRNCERNSHRH